MSSHTPTTAIAGLAAADGPADSAIKHRADRLSGGHRGPLTGDRFQHRSRYTHYASVSSDPRHPLRIRLRQNAVDRWTPRAPVRIYHSPEDEEAPIEGALASAERLWSGGADVTVRTLPGFDHVNS